MREEKRKVKDERRRLTREALRAGGEEVVKKAA